jgi:hypothetical protein
MRSHLRALSHDIRDVIVVTVKYAKLVGDWRRV